jgi:phosphoribosylformylglycinamidine cyclo-ligase
MSDTPEESGTSLSATSSYRSAGVDIEAGDEAVKLIAKHAATTKRPEVLGDLGGFAGAFAFDSSRYADPVLFGATDGVGTKLAIAQTLGVHDTVGLDLVAMVVDDLVCHGAEPLFLLDYISCGRLVPAVIEQIVAGIAEGCRIAGCALLGGETAEHPGVIDPDSYDLAAFAVGVAERSAILGSDRVRSGDVVIGLASSGLHSNGFSLVRRIILEHDLSLDVVDETLTRPLGEILLTPTRIHAPAVLATVQAAEVHAAAHITGGGIAGNLVRVLPEGLSAVLDSSAWTEPEIFEFLRKTGQISPEEMRRVFNLGVGMTIVVERAKVGTALETLASRGEKAFVMGEIRPGPRGVQMA